ncbi:MAG: hypothetical protein M3224_00770 [Thermoproteota archaeon]|nr:hypothetical protein [Thermoproteota archaeon]
MTFRFNFYIKSFLIEIDRIDDDDDDKLTDPDFDDRKYICKIKNSFELLLLYIVTITTATSMSVFSIKGPP